MKALYREKGGIGHILAISGLHMSFIGMGFYGLLRRVGCPVKPAGVLGILFFAWLHGYDRRRGICNPGICYVWHPG
mgnify:CR=1 FL=1